MNEYVEKQEVLNIVKDMRGLARTDVLHEAIKSITKLQALTKAEIAEQYLHQTDERGLYDEIKKRCTREFAEKLKEKFRDFKEWETEDGYQMHTMSEKQRICRCIDFVDTLLDEMGCNNE